MAASVQNPRKSLWISAQTPVWRGFQRPSLPHWPACVQLSAASKTAPQIRIPAHLLPLSLYSGPVTAGDLPVPRLRCIDGSGGTDDRNLVPSLAPSDRQLQPSETRPSNGHPQDASTVQSVWTLVHKWKRRRLQHQHAIAIREEAVSFLHGMAIRRQNRPPSRIDITLRHAIRRKGAHQHQQCGLRQMEVRQQA